jgi:hypothetical protein
MMPQFVSIQSKLLILAVKDTERPTEAEIKELIRESTLGNQHFEFHVLAMGFPEIRTFYRGLTVQTSGPDVNTMSDGQLLSHGMMARAAAEMQQHGVIGVTCQLFAITNAKTKGLYLLEITGPAETKAPVPPPPAKPVAAPSGMFGGLKKLFGK